MKLYCNFYSTNLRIYFVMHNKVKSTFKKNMFFLKFFLKVDFSIEIFMPVTVIIFEISTYPRVKFPLKKSSEFLRISDSGFVHVVFEGTLGLILLNKDPLKTRKSNGDFNVLLILHHDYNFQFLSNNFESFCLRKIWSSTLDQVL